MSALIDFIETIILVAFSFVFGAAAGMGLISKMIQVKAPDFYPKYNELLFEGWKE